MTKTMRGVFILAVLGVLFQIGHFFEHAVQWLMWIFSDRSKPWMSAIADWLAMQSGRLVYPMPDICTDEKAWMAKQMFYGMEVLHLIGNSIFLSTIGFLLIYFSSDQRVSGLPNIEQVRWRHQKPDTLRFLKIAFAIEAFHLYEHIMLTVTAFTLGKPVGFSTLFGGTSFFQKENAVGYRVSWHFFMNFIPSIFVMKALMPHVKRMGQVEKYMKKIIRPPLTSNEDSVRIFLAGSIEQGKARPWHEEVVDAASEGNLTVEFYNPRRIDWDSSLTESVHDPVFREQVNWELDNIDNADCVFFFFQPGTFSPISLLELGKAVEQKKKLIVVCPKGFWRRGNIEVMALRHGFDVFDEIEDGISELNAWLAFKQVDSLQTSRSK